MAVDEAGAAGVHELVAGSRFDGAHEWVERMLQALPSDALPQAGGLPLLADLVTAEVSLDGLLGGATPMGMASSSWQDAGDCGMGELAQMAALTREQMQEHA